MGQTNVVSPPVSLLLQPRAFAPISFADPPSALRDTVEQDDGVTNYGWTVYDPRVGGSQVICDKDLGVDLTTDFVKNDDASAWAVRVSGAVRPDAAAHVVKTSLLFHIAMEGAIGSSSKSLGCERLPERNGHINGVLCRGKDPDLGPFDLRINADPQDQVIKSSMVRSKTVDDDEIWQAKCKCLHHVQHI